MDFSQEIRAQLAGEIVRVSRLAEFNFKSGPQRYWPGHHRFVAKNRLGNDVTWVPTMGIGAVSGIQQASNGAAPEIRFELSGVDPGFAAKAVAEAEEFYGRTVFVYWQFFGRDWRPLGDPKVIIWGLMRSIISTRRATDTGYVSILSLTAETPFDGRARSRNSYLTDLDQKARYRDDRLLERIAGLEAREIKWPVFEAD